MQGNKKQKTYVRYFLKLVFRTLFYRKTQNIVPLPSGRKNMLFVFNNNNNNNEICQKVASLDLRAS